MGRLIWILCGVLLASAGCKNILGIDERKLDIAELTSQGYAGCEPSDGVCNGCTSDWHQCICEDWKNKDEAELRLDCAERAPESIRAEAIQAAEKSLEAAQKQGQVNNPFSRTFDEDFCEAPPKDDACMACFCDDCGEGMAACAADKSCQAIMNCFMESDCDPTKDGPGGCTEHQGCDDVVDEHGSKTGEPHNAFLLAIQCVIDQQCPCEDDGPGGGPQTCTPPDGCSSCGTCWERCFCEGKDQGQCQTECGNPDCVPERQCNSCAACIDSCLCTGDGDPAACSQLCSAGGGNQCFPTSQCTCTDCISQCSCKQLGTDTCQLQCEGAAVCNPEAGCVGCLDCFNRCRCEGGTPASCANSCPPAAVCGPLDSCAGCTTCVGECACEGKKPFHECLTSCDVASCDGSGSVPDCETCSTCVSECGCEGNGELDCRTECVTADCNLTFSEPCDQCACNFCGFEFAACNDQKGCFELMECITRTGCSGTDDCAKPATCEKEAEAVGGTTSPAMGVVEALKACRRREGCSCGPANPLPG